MEYGVIGVVNEDRLMAMIRWKPAWKREEKAESLKNLHSILADVDCNLYFYSFFCFLFSVVVVLSVSGLWMIVSSWAVTKYYYLKEGIEGTIMRCWSLGCRRKLGFGRGGRSRIKSMLVEATREKEGQYQSMLIDGIMEAAIEMKHWERGTTSKSKRNCGTVGKRRVTGK